MTYYEKVNCMDIDFLNRCLLSKIGVDVLKGE